ncbi:CbtA family protein [Bradyrhizobium sp.]|uniref:CbtA family protein n=1 Tax=Bradyrhizobium sp. TaxID=376 RepID=UPI0026156AFE|nr:CbtA family protein [Bradyrhizobium sp.]
MIGKLLVRGMLLGLVAGLLSFGFLKLAGEPSVDRAIAFESAMEEARAAEDKAKGLPAPVEEPELVSRHVQAGVGLLTGVAVYSTAFGGLFSLAFALAYRRMGDFGARATSALLAMAGFVSVYLTPVLKYPANPPSVGLAETIDMRTSLYFAMILISLAAMIAAGMLRLRLAPRFGNWNAALMAAAAYVVVVSVVAMALPEVNEVPEGFPATLLWQFRIASLGGQAIMWGSLGLLFGLAAERVFAAHEPLLRRSTV